MQKIQLSDHFTYKKLFKFCLPSVAMMILTSMYGVVDGVFISNVVGKVPFAAVNILLPLIMILNSFGFMIGAGGSALVAKTLGENDPENANRYFTMMIKFTVIMGVTVSALGIIFILYHFFQLLYMGFLEITISDFKKQINVKLKEIDQW